jgi:hypothetical protein
MGRFDLIEVTIWAGLTVYIYIYIYNGLSLLLTFEKCRLNWYDPLVIFIFFYQIYKNV